MQPLCEKKEVNRRRNVDGYCIFAVFTYSCGHRPAGAPDLCGGIGGSGFCRDRIAYLQWAGMASADSLFPARAVLSDGRSNEWGENRLWRRVDDSCGRMVSAPVANVDAAALGLSVSLSV